MITVCLLTRTGATTGTVYTWVGGSKLKSVWLAACLCVCVCVCVHVCDGVCVVYCREGGG